jgi:hypothetical protein
MLSEVNNIEYTPKPNSDLNLTQKKEFMKLMDTLTPTTTESFYALVKCHEILNKPAENKDAVVTTDLPYGGMVKNKGVEFDLLLLPIQLRHILYRFLLKTVSNK